MPRPPRSPLFVLPNDVWGWVQFMKVFIVQLPPFYCYDTQEKNFCLYVVWMALYRYTYYVSYNGIDFGVKTWGTAFNIYTLYVAPVVKFM
jgi:hypothetical protein